MHFQSSMPFEAVNCVPPTPWARKKAVSRWNLAVNGQTQMQVEA